jgi:hypothetical protein
MVVCYNCWLSVHRYNRKIIIPWWYTGSQSTNMLEPLALWGCMPGPLVPRKVTSVRYCLLPAEKNQLQMETTSENIFVWLLLLLFYFHVPLSFHENWGTKDATCRDLCRWKALIWWGAAQYPKGIISDTAITTSVPCSPWHNNWHLGFSGPEPCLPSKDAHACAHTDTARMPGVGFWKGKKW